MSERDGFYLYYPRGYRRWLSEQEAVTYGLTRNDERQFADEGDYRVGEMMRYYHQVGERFQRFREVHAVLKIASDLIGDVNHFFAAQRDNPYLSPQNFDYLFEIARFLESGRQTLSPQSAIDYLDEHPKLQQLGYRRLPRLPHAEGSTTLLRYWLMHDGGFENILWNLMILFGPTRKDSWINQRPDVWPRFPQVPANPDWDG